ncbi:pentatricopeptide repeat-containing protein [Dorcoceras hygrometricum]|uniref:Pentatricopeptide repeat-containing protein n=1 Tax=Dorcoceras hygrometricum TaxID=472368 RepID=A0A2Z7B4U8_9LAMI|nr:pentatricopeptide repeat-containing protein [Dorcoceras hygrometricum]
MGLTAGSISRQLNLPAITTTPGVSNLRLSAKALTTTILNNLRLGRLPEAVSILFASSVRLPFSLYAHLLQICAKNMAIIETRKVEWHLITLNPNPPVFLLNRAIESYGNCGCLRDAKELFDEMPRRNGGSWNAIITAYTRNGFAEDALGLFSRMIGLGVFASEITFASVLGSCGNALELWLSRQVHGLIMKYGFVGNVILESSIVDVYGKCHVMSDARRMFDEIRHPNNVSWNVIIRRYFDTGDGKEAVNMFSKMVKVNASPMSFTVSNAIIACSSYGGLREGAQIHGYAIKINMEEGEVVSSTLIGMYAKCGDLGSARRIFDFPCSKNLISCTTMVSGYAVNGKTTEARELFDQMTERSVISWNVMLAGYTRFLMWDKALDFVIMMRKSTTEIDHVTLGLILNICAAIPDVELGKQIHGYAYRNGFYTNLFVGNALLDMYGKCGNLTRARIWFYEMSHLRDKVSWNALLTSYARHGLSEEAMMIFGKMLGETKPSKFTFGTLLAACANIFALELGKQIHAFMLRNGYDVDVVINGALVDMYSKCRYISSAIKIFNCAASKDVILCNTMILGCLHNGLSDKVFELFETMEKEGMRPDHVTFQGILQASVSAGRVELGRQYFELMSEKYCLTPQLEHYDAVIELYGQHGFMDKLELFINNMPFNPTAPILTKVELEDDIEFLHRSNLSSSCEGNSFRKTLDSEIKTGNPCKGNKDVSAAGSQEIIANDIPQPKFQYYVEISSMYANTIAFYQTIATGK